MDIDYEGLTKQFIEYLMELKGLNDTIFWLLERDLNVEDLVELGFDRDDLLISLELYYRKREGL